MQASTTRIHARGRESVLGSGLPHQRHPPHSRWPLPSPAARQQPLQPATPAPRHNTTAAASTSGGNNSTTPATTTTPSRSSRSSSSEPLTGPSVSQLPLPPGSSGWPLLGETAEFLREPVKFMRSRRELHGDIFRSQLLGLGSTTVFVFDTAAVRAVLGGEHGLVQQRWPAPIRNLLGPSFQGSKAAHAFQRRVMGQAFTPDAVAAYLPELQAIMSRRLAALAQVTASGGGTGVTPGDEGSTGVTPGEGCYDAWEEHHRITFEVAAQLLLGYNMTPAEEEELSGLFTQFVRGFSLGLALPVPWTPYGRAQAARTTILQRLEVLLEQQLGPPPQHQQHQHSAGAGPGVTSQAAAAAAATAGGAAAADSSSGCPFLHGDSSSSNSGNVPQQLEGHPQGITTTSSSHTTHTTPSSSRAGSSVLELFQAEAAAAPPGLEVGRGELKELALFTLFAGHETTGSALSFLVAWLYRRPDVYRAVQEEQDRVVEQYGPDLTPGALGSMPFTEAVCREVLRLNPVVGSVWRTALQDFQLMGYRIPKGAAIMASVRQPARSVPEWEGDAEDFRPQRWLEYDPEVKKAPPGYLPFGGGPRVCLGYGLAVTELRGFLALLARGYEFDLVNDPWEGIFKVGLAAGGGMPMRLYRRHSAAGQAAAASAAARGAGGAPVTHIYQT